MERVALLAAAVAACALLVLAPAPALADSNDVADFFNGIGCGVLSVGGCQSCVEQTGCYYCERTGFCLGFTGDGHRAYFPDTDSCPLQDAMWLQCALDYQALVIIAAVLLILLLLTCGCCCFCCCCR